jgi:hypothetical protein
LLSTWLDADIPEQQQMLSEDAQLLSDEAVTLLGQWADQDPDDITLMFGRALLSLAQEGLDARVLAAADEPEEAIALLAELLADNLPPRLLAATDLLLCLDLADQIIAEARLHHAIALALTGHTEAATEDARAAARRGPENVSRWLAVLAPLVAANPEVASLIQALVTPPPDEANDASSRNRPAAPGL